MSVLFLLNNVVHKLMRGRCWCPDICERLSYYEAMRDES